MAGVGESWENLGYLDEPGNQGTVDCLIDLGDGKVLAGIWAGGAKSLIYRSTDYGETWVDLGRPVNEQRIYCFAYLGWGIVIAGTGFNAKILYSIDYGQTWTDLGNQCVGEQHIMSFASLGEGTVLGGTSIGMKIIRSVDYGQTWSTVTQIDAGGGKVNCLEYLGNNILIAGIWDGSLNGRIYRSVDNGENWTAVGTGGGSEILSLAYLGDGIVLAGTNANPAEVLRSTDYGATWGVINTFATHTRIYSLVYLGNGIVIAGTGDTNGHLFRSIDYGVNWTDLGRQYNAQSILSLVELDDGRGLAGTGPAAVYAKILRSLASGNGGGGGESGDSEDKKKKIILTHWEWKDKAGNIVDAYIAPEDTRCTQVFYDGRVLSVSPVSRAVDDRTGLYSISDMTLELANADKEYSKMLTKYFLKNQLIEVFQAWSDGPEASKTAVLKGIVVDYWMEGTSFFVLARDTTQKYFKIKVPTEVCT